MLKMDYIRENALSAVRELEDGLRGTQERLQREELLTQRSLYHRIAAIAALLADADVASFRRELRLSALARREVLSAAPPTLAPGRFRCASRVEPLFDALAAGEADLARELAHHAPRRWVEDEEFEDDFRYADFLHEHLLAGGRTTSPGAERALSAFHKCSAETGSPRLALCEAVFAGDQKSFDAALEDLLVERAAEFKNAGPSRHPMRFQTERHVFIEGLALLRLAEERGLRTQPEYRMMPGLARR